MASATDWSRWQRRFKAVGEGVVAALDEGGDAGGLAAFFLPDEEEAMGAVISGLRRPEMKGLAQLVSQITVLLNEAHAAQQTFVAGLNAECAQCAKVAASLSSLSLQPDAVEDLIEVVPAGHSSSGRNISSADVSIKGGSSWASLPSADEEDLDGPASSGPAMISQRITGLFSSSSAAAAAAAAKDPAEAVQQRMTLLRKQLQHRIQGVHDRAVDLLDVKLQAHETIIHCKKAYCRELVRQAKAKYVTRATERAAMLADEAVAPLRAHRFLDAADAQDVVVFVRELWATTYLDSQKTLAERRLVLSHAAAAPWLSHGQSLWHVKLGVGAGLLIWGLSECFNNEEEGRKIWQDPTFAIFMAFGDLLLLFWMWGVSMQVWRTAGIDFVQLLNLEGTGTASQRRPEHAVYSSATNLTLVFLSVFICFNKAARGVLHVHLSSLAVAHALPAVMVLYFVYCFVTPLSTRWRWLGFLGQVLAAPGFPVCFRDGYVGDLLTSLVRVFVPLCFSFAYLGLSALAWLTEGQLTGAVTNTDSWWRHDVFRLLLVPFLTLFPLWIRLMQCLRRSVETGRRWPHMANALKYTSAIVVISFGTFQPQLRGNATWRAGFVFATLFQYVWDLTMDWGLVVFASSPGASPHSWGGMALRRVRLLGGLGLYLGVVVGNLLLRFAWTLTLLPANPNDHSLYGLLLAYLSPLAAAAEIVRRMVWGFLRLEHEQLEVLGADSLTTAEVGAGSGAGAGAGAGASGFERMGVAAATAGQDGGKGTPAWDADGRYSGLPIFSPSKGGANAAGAGTGVGVGVSIASSAWCWEREWLPLPAGLVDYAASSVGLGADASHAAKARLVEAVLFASAVFAVILVAALGAPLSGEL